MVPYDGIQGIGQIQFDRQRLPRAGCDGERFPQPGWIAFECRRNSWHKLEGDSNLAKRHGRTRSQQETAHKGLHVSECAN